MSKEIFAGLKVVAPAAGLDLSSVSHVRPPEVAPEALRAAQADGEANGFRARGGGSPAWAAAELARPAPTPTPPRVPGRVRVREMRAAEPEIGRGMQKASFTALVPVDIMERFMALEASTGAKRWHLLTLALQDLEHHDTAGTLKARTKSAVQNWATTVEDRNG